MENVVAIVRMIGKVSASRISTEEAEALAERHGFQNVEFRHLDGKRFQSRVKLSHNACPACHRTLADRTTCRPCYLTGRV